MLHPPAIFILSFLLLRTAIAEDQVSLKNQDLLIGEITALKDGLIELKTPHSKTPLKIRSQNLLKLNFHTNSPGELPKDSQILKLHNGDHFPGQITQLSETHLHFKTWFAGTLTIPRPLINSLHFGVTPQKIISQGPKRMSDWTQDQAAGWTLRKGRLSSSKNTFIGKNLHLPENFIFAADIAWRNTPNLRIHICSEQLRPKNKKTDDSYLIAITRSGIEVKRIEPSSGPTPSYHTLITHVSNFGASLSKNIHLELRVNRKKHTLHLYLNGHEIEQGVDPNAPPIGTHVLFESLDNTNGNNLISEITIKEWDSTTQLLHREARKSDDSDTLAVAEGDRFSGTITHFDSNSSSPYFTVRSPLSSVPIKIPLIHCSVIYFAKNPENPSSNKHYQLNLHTGGKLSFSDITLGKVKLEGAHPWLGNLKVNRRAMSSIRKDNSQN